LQKFLVESLVKSLVESVLGVNSVDLPKFKYSATVIDESETVKRSEVKTLNDGIKNEENIMLKSKTYFEKLRKIDEAQQS
jgi:hypothetical protein